MTPALDDKGVLAQVIFTYINLFFSNCDEYFNNHFCSVVGTALPLSSFILHVRRSTFTSVSRELV